MREAVRVNEHLHSGAVTLFSHFELEIPVQHPPPREMPNTATRYSKTYGHLRLVVVGENRLLRAAHETPCEQLALEFMQDNENNVVKLITRSRRIFLTYGVFDSFRHNPDLRRPARKLEKLGYGDIGLLVQLTEAELRALPFIEDKHVQAMKEQLAQAGLLFGMTVPGWEKAPQRQR